MPRIALFGGAFDPPHLGHVLCAAYALTTARLDALWVLPAAKHPYGKPMAPFGKRLELCRAAFAALAAVSVRDDELRNPGGYTFDLVTSLHAAHTDTQFCLVGGTDTGRDLPRWYRGSELAALVEIIAVPRRGFDDAHPAALPAISSTLVRERLRAGQAVDDMVPASVIDLLRELY